MGKQTSMNFASVIATFTPNATGFSPVVFKSDTFFNEEEFLGEPQPDRERARLFMSNDGNAGQYLDIFAISGKRDITIFDGIQADLLQHWAFNNPQPMFDLSFSYQRNDQTAAEIRTHIHYGCKFMNHPARAMSNDIVVVKFTFKYAKFEILGPTGSKI